VNNHQFQSFQEAKLEYAKLTPEQKASADTISRNIWYREKVPPLYIDLDLERDWYGDKSAKDEVLKYLRELDIHYGNGIGLHFQGEFGTGKTFLMCHVLKEAIRSYAPYKEPMFSGYFATFSDLINLYTEGWYSREDRDQFDFLLKRVDFLAIDDLGKEYKSKSSLNMAALDSVVRTRIYKKKIIFLTTNRDMEGIENDYGAGITSLLKQACIRITVEGEDFREKMEQER